MNPDNLKKEIKKIKVGHVALLCACVFVAFAIIGTILLAAGGGWLVNGLNINFRNFPLIGVGELYEVNDRQELDMAGVDRVVIESVSDDITVLSGGDKAVAELKGQCRGTSGSVKLDARKSGGTVTIEVKYPRTLSNSNTRLTVTIPDGYAGDFSVSTVSGDVASEGLPFKLASVSLHSTSGELYFSAQYFDDIKADTTSGDIRISNIAGRVTATSISGEVDLDFTAAVATTVSTVSGDVKARVPENAAFKVDFDTVSGGFRSSHPALDVKDADHGFSGSMEGGTELLKVNTTSGDFIINGK